MTTLHSDAYQYKYPVSFTGTGSEYFKIWIVNLLLTIISFGVYYPWAKVRKNKYVYSNTLVDGVAFDYLGTGSVLLKGMLITGVLSVMYNFALNSGSWLIFFIFSTTIALLIPWLIWKSFRFKLSISSYRALSFSFLGTLKDAYKNFLPVIIFNAIFIGFIFNSTSNLKYLESNNIKPTEYNISNIDIVFSLIFLSIFALLPLFHWLLKKYQHNNYQWAGLRTQFYATPRQFYKQWVFATLPYLCIFLISIIAMIIIDLYINYVNDTKNISMIISTFILNAPFMMLIVMILMYLVIPAISLAIFNAGLQNIIWNSTQVNGIVFNSHLRVKTLFWLYVKNYLLTLITFGLYWPFAVINIIKTKLSAVTIITELPIMYLAKQETPNYKERNATGDEIVDLFGIDISL